MYFWGQNSPKSASPGFSPKSHIQTQERERLRCVESSEGQEGPSPLALLPLFLTSGPPLSLMASYTRSLVLHQPPRHLQLSEPGPRQGLPCGVGTLPRTGQPRGALSPPPQKGLEALTCPRRPTDRGLFLVAKGTGRRGQAALLGQEKGQKWVLVIIKAACMAKLFTLVGGLVSGQGTAGVFFPFFLYF